MSAIGGVILLSSSPPRVFARSPTPIDNPSSSSPLPSPATIFASQRSQVSQDARASLPTGLTGVDRHRKFRLTSTFREGFGSGFGSSKKLRLQEKPNKENIPIPRRVEGLEKGVGPEKQDVQRPVSPEGSQLVKKDKGLDNATTRPHAYISLEHDSKAQSRRTEACRSQELRPLGLDKASSRRLDWTPPASRCSQNSPEPALVSFSESLLGNFGYHAASNGTKDRLTINPGNENNPTKRRKLDIVDAGALVTAAAMAAPKLPPETNKAINEPLRIRKKSPKKKYTTITGLATSHYFGEEINDASPMMQYLSATQQRALDLDFDSVPDTAKRKKAAEKSKATKKAPRKSTLRSPQSAMKAFDDQAMLFGSASQLARDESPTFIRDTVQARKRSEDTPLMSDPVSTQITISTSEPAETPKRHDRRGVSRFVRTRNLWSVAGRDDDNALLQVDTVDMFDSPDIRTAFAGKDVLLEPGAPRFRDRTSPGEQVAAREDPMRMFSGADQWLSPGLRGGEWPRLHDAEGIIDIDELTPKTPYAVRTSKTPLQVRGLHTAAAGKKPSNQADAPSKDLPLVPPGPLPNPQPNRPSYNGFTTGQLASQLAAYGFKPIKKREKMIEVLDRCWDDKHNVSGQDTDVTAALNQTNKVSHGDILTKLHDISARPTPKVKKPRGKPKKEGASPPVKSTPKKPLPTTAGEVVAVEGEASAEKPKKARRVRKAKDSTSTSSASLQTKTALNALMKVRKAPLSEEYIMDIDDIEDGDQGFDQGFVEIQRDTTGVKRAGPGRQHFPPPISPSSDAFETASWMEEALPASKAKPSSKKAVQSTNRRTSKKSNPKSASATAPGPPPPIAAAVILPAPPPLPRITPSTSPSQPPLSTQITLAITTSHLPTSATHHNSQQNPNFYQKILMYDAIILEDLAAWLNTEGFKAIGEDREVGPPEVRAWCEERGVCCLWRGGWRGNGGGKGVRGPGKGKEMQSGLDDDNDHDGEP